MLNLITQLLPVVGEVIDRVVPDPKAREEAKLQMVKQAQEGKFKQAEQQLSVIMAEAQSKDPWTSRARPAFLYVVYLLILTSIPMAIVHAFNPELSQRLIEGFNGWLTAIPEPIITLFGVGYLGYTGARSYDKFKIKGKDYSAVEKGTLLLCKKENRPHEVVFFTDHIKIKDYLEAIVFTDKEQYDLFKNMKGIRFKNKMILMQ